MADRPQKSLKLDYWNESDDDAVAHVTVLGGEDAEVRIGTGDTFIGITEDALSFSGGFPSKFNIQGLSGSMNYGGMLSDNPFPTALLPSTTYTPFPSQSISPPFLSIIPEIAKLGSIASAFMV